MKILHIIQDDKFSDSAYQLFESVAPGQNTYVVLRKAGNPLKYIKKIKSLITAPRWPYWDPAFAENVLSHEILILHGLTLFAQEVVAKFSGRVKIVWIGMGYDYYDLLYENKLELLAPHTRSIIVAQAAFLKKQKIGNLARLKSAIQPLFHPGRGRKKEQVQRIDYFAPVLKPEYKLVEQGLGSLRPQFIDWNYGMAASLFEEKMPHGATGKNILVGNSAAPTNNHFDIFDKLKNIKLPRDAEVIVPLSYGCEGGDYKRAVIEEGKKIFKRQFCPITEFMEYSEYIALLASCRVAIMNQRRQQAVGNILASLYVGGKVFLNTENSFYDLAKSWGVHLYSLEQLSDKHLHSVLPVESAKLNREILRRHFSRSVLEKKTRDLINLVSSNVF